MEHIIKIGELNISLNSETESYTLTEEISIPKKFHLKLNLESIKNSHLNNEISLIIKSQNEEKVHFKGKIEKLWFDEGKVNILAYDMLQELKKDKMNAEFINFQPQDIIYTIVKWKGFKPNIPNSKFTQEENEYEVIIPINNINSDNISIKLNNIVLSNNLDTESNEVISKSSFKENFFKKNNSFIKIELSAIDFNEAYNKAILKVNDFLDYFSFLKNYSLPEINNKVITWNYDNYKSIPKISSTFFAKRKDNNYTLIFDSNIIKVREHYISLSENKKINDEFDSMFQNTYSNEVDLEINFGLHWLRRAREFGILKDKLLDYFMSIEFIVSNQECIKLFEKTKLKEIRELVKDKLNKKQIERFNSYIGGLNEPSFKLRLETFIKDNKINLSSKQETILKQLREDRNQLEHGKGDIKILTNDLKILDNIIEKMLIKKIKNNNKNQDK